jgi:hypothetical protein
MNKVRLVLTLITVAITVGPVLGVVIAYQNNLPGLIIPDKIEQIMSGLGNTNPQNIIQPGQTGTPDVQFDPASRTFTASFPFTNPLPVDTTINSISGPIECDEHHVVLGDVSLKNPVTVKAGATATATVQGTWTETAVDHFQTAHPGEKTVPISIVGASINFGGAIIKYSQPISIGAIPLT